MGVKVTDRKIGAVDAHCHVWPAEVDVFPVAPGVSADARRPEGYPIETHRDRLARLSVDAAVLVPHIAYYGRDLGYALECAQRYPGECAVLGAITRDEVADPSRLAGDLRQDVRAFRIRAADLEQSVATLGRFLADNAAALCPLLTRQQAENGVLARVLAIACDHPEMPVVLDHFGGAGGPGVIQALAPFADLQNVSVKVSGFNTFDAPPYAQARRSMVELCARFGADRLMWGSDMPVLEVGEGHSLEAAFGAVEQAPELTRRQKDAVLSGTARRIFFQR
jgi:L-fuconolactonase